jgi:hypothetical protein
LSAASSNAKPFLAVAPSAAAPCNMYELVNMRRSMRVGGTPAECDPVIRTREDGAAVGEGSGAVAGQSRAGARDSPGELAVVSASLLRAKLLEPSAWPFVKLAVGLSGSSSSQDPR